MAAMSITLDKSDVVSAAMHVAKQLGYPEMKDLQVKVVVDFVCGRDVFAVLPTGYGKSLCYACLPGVFDLVHRNESPCIVCVITPLTAIVENQVPV